MRLKEYMRRSIAILLAVLALSACAQVPASPSPTSAPVPTAESSQATGTPLPSPTSALSPVASSTPTAPAQTETATSMPTATPDAAGAAAIQATVVAGLPPTATSAPGDTPIYTGIVSATVVPLVGEGAGLYAVGSIGTRSFDPIQNHFVALYGADNGAWRELARLELDNPDFVGEGALTQVEIAPGRVWLALESGVGAHGGCFDLLSYDGSTLSDTLATCHGSPAAAYIDDIDGNGVNEVIVNQTEDYVFCYACGVKLINLQPLEWDGQKFIARGLDKVDGSRPEAQAVNQAIEQASAGLWKDAQATLAQLPAATALDPQAAWDVGSITLIASARADQAHSGAYPLIDNLFYGDYAAALDTLRPLTPAERFDPNGPLFTGTPAEGWVDSFTYAITSTTDLALAAQPDRPEALFLRGLALELSDPGSADAIAAIERASQLAPDETLYSESLAYLKSK